MADVAARRKVLGDREVAEPDLVPDLGDQPARVLDAVFSNSGMSLERLVRGEARSVDPL